MPSKHVTRPYKHRSPIDKAKAYEVVWHQVSSLFEAARRYADASFIYVIGEPEDGPLKIGYSKDPIARLRNMQTGNPRRLRIEYVLVGGMETEKLLHQFWEPHAIISASSKRLPGVAPGTEWFKSRVRAELLPIIQEAIKSQIWMLSQDEHPPSFNDMETAVREAHAGTGFIAHIVEPTRQLAQGAGYVESRRLRI